MTTTAKRRPGRPATVNPSGERVHLDVIVAPDLRQRVRHAAVDAHQNTSEWVRQAIEERLVRHGAA